MKRVRVNLVKSALVMAAATALALPLYAQIAPEEDPASMRRDSRAQDNADYDPEPYYIDGIEYKPYNPTGSKPQKVQNPQPVTNPNPAGGSGSTGIASGNPSVTPGQKTPYVGADGKPIAGASASASDSESSAAPIVPDKRVRYGSAIVQVLDKVTADTVRFEAPIGKPRRYKGMVFTVKACETSALDEPMSDVMAYMEVRTSPTPAANGTVPKPKQVFQGWVYASTPGLNPMEHAVYDAWVVSCRTPLVAPVVASK